MLYINALYGRGGCGCEVAGVSICGFLIKDVRLGLFKTHGGPLLTSGGPKSRRKHNVES